MAAGVTDQNARGALWGLAVGDALGTTHEFKALAAPDFPSLALGPLTDIVGGGPFGVAAGQVTDDTQMACCLAASLRSQPSFDVSDVAARYVAWMERAFDIGSQTRAALAAVAGGRAPVDAGCEVWIASGRRAAGNGSLMRTVPIAVRFSAADEARRRASLLDSAITHYDPRCRIACAAFNAAVAHAVEQAPTDPASLVAVAAEEVQHAMRALRAEAPGDSAEIEAAAGAIANDLAAAARDNPDLYGADLHIQRTQGFVRVAFRLAFWELLHAPTFSSALIDVVNRGGDADTNGAIAGALLGAFHGAGAIPAAWRQRVEGALQDGPSSPWRDTYHPRRLLDLLGEGPG
ncbi:MAG: ADP-ribosylglycohydrolase family protein [Myxococcales bacterium]|nr:ADP-ribosylglycohydrolase family protein [Myxococcales bacterium]